MTAKRKSRRTPGPPKFPQAPPQDASRRTQTSPERPPLPKTPAQPGTSSRRDISAASTTSSATLAHKESASARGGKGKGQCVPPRPSPLEPSEANASSEIPPLRSGKLAFSHLFRLKSFPDSLCGRTQDVSAVPIPSL